MHLYCVQGWQHNHLAKTKTTACG